MQYQKNQMKADNLKLFEYLGHSPVVGLIIFALLFSACAWLAPGDMAPAKVPGSKEGSSAMEGGVEIRDAYGNFALASIAIRHGLYEEARKYLSHAVLSDPNSLYLCRKMALLLKKLKQYEDALAYATKCIELEPNDINSRLLLGDLYALTNDDDSALQQYNMALDHDPDNQRIRLLVTNDLYQEGLVCTGHGASESSDR